MPTYETQRFTNQGTVNSVWGPHSTTNQWQPLGIMHTSERGNWTQNISDPRRYYGADEPLRMPGQKTWSQAVASSDPRNRMQMNHMYSHQAASTKQPTRIVAGKTEWSQIVANPRRYNQQPGQDYQTGRGNQHPILGGQKWPSQQESSRFNTGQYHISTLRQRPKMHKPLRQNRLGNTMQLMGSNPLPGGGTRGAYAGKLRARGSPASKRHSKVSVKIKIIIQ